MRRISADFLRNEHGFAAGEFALWLPVILLILLGCFDATRFIMIHQKLDRAATQAADLVGQSDGMTVAQLDGIYAAAIAQMEPYDMETRGEIIISSVWSDAGNDKVAWQRSHGSVSGGSQIGAEGGPATLPDNFYLDPSENTIAAEVLYEYEPVFFGVLGGLKNLGGEPLFGEIFQPATFQHNAWVRPRGATLMSPPTS
jgi:TadE-like protein